MDSRQKSPEVPDSLFTGPSPKSTVPGLKKIRIVSPSATLAPISSRMRAKGQVPNQIPTDDSRSLSVVQPEKVTFAKTSGFVIFPRYRDMNQKLWNWPKRLHEENFRDYKILA